MATVHMDELPFMAVAIRLDSVVLTVDRISIIPEQTNTAIFMQDHAQAAHCIQYFPMAFIILQRYQYIPCLHALTIALIFYPNLYI